MYSLADRQQINVYQYGNRGVTWEEALKSNYAIDIDFYQRLKLSFDYFTEKRDNILSTDQLLPFWIGVRSNQMPNLNLAKVNNEGFELELAYHGELGSNTTFSVAGNYSHNRNEVIYMSEAKRDETYM